MSREIYVFGDWEELGKIQGYQPIELDEIYLQEA